MAGHSHWHNIQQKKGKNDAKKNVLFSKAAQQILMAARDGGGDPDHNLSLKIAIDAAKAVNMPKDNIDRAIRKGTGSEEGVHISRALYEGLGPHKIPIIVLTYTDNTNRTVSDLRNIFSKAGGELGSQGAVMWQFTESGRVVVKSAKVKKAEKFGEENMEVPVPTEEAMLDIMEIEGVVDISEDEEDSSTLYIMTSITDANKVSKHVSEKGYIVTSAGPHYEPNNPVRIPEDKEESFASFLETLEDYQDVQTIWHGAA